MAGSPTSILVRVQAKGGKFLADDIGGAEVVIRDAQTGRWLGGGLANGTDSGTLSPSYTSAASLSVIVTPATPSKPEQVQWLVANPGTTAGLPVDLQIDRPTLLEITAFGPMGGLQSAHRVTTTQWIVPGQTIDQGPGFIVELPGLLVQVLAPPTHSVYQTQVAVDVPLIANVTMMCGCPIAASGTWLESDFQVTAAVGPAGKPATATVLLAYAGTTSRFQSGYQAVPGVYQAVITAVQTSTGNTGTGTVTFTVESAS